MIAYLFGKLRVHIFTKKEAYLAGQTENLLHKHYEVESYENYYLKVEYRQLHMTQSTVGLFWIKYIF